MTPFKWPKVNWRNLYCVCFRPHLSILILDCKQLTEYSWDSDQTLPWADVDLDTEGYHNQLSLLLDQESLIAAAAEVRRFFLLLSTSLQMTQQNATQPGYNSHMLSPGFAGALASGIQDMIHPCALHTKVLKKHMLDIQ